MGVIEQQKIEVEMQFISIADSILLIADCENTDTDSVLLWFRDQDELIHKQLMLEKKSVLSLVEFNPLDDKTGEYYESPTFFLVEYLKLAFVYDDIKKLLSVKKIGFARKRFLFSLLNLGIDVKENYLNNAISYIPHSNNEYDAHSVNTYKYLTEHVSELVQENAELNKKIGTNQLLEHDPLQSDYEALEAENAQLNQRITELEQQLKQSQNKPDVLAYILDPTQENYAPDLALSIQLYQYVYIDSPRQDSHSSKANTWVKNNTGYDMSNESVTRIRAITAPFKDWGKQRDKNYFKK